MDLNTLCYYIVKTSNITVMPVIILVMTEVLKNICFPSFPGVEMEWICVPLLLFSGIHLAFTQFNGFNCDPNYHSRFPGKKLRARMYMLQNVNNNILLLKVHQ